MVQRAIGIRQGLLTCYITLHILLVASGCVFVLARDAGARVDIGIVDSMYYFMPLGSFLGAGSV